VALGLAHRLLDEVEDHALLVGVAMDAMDHVAAHLSQANESKLHPVSPLRGWGWGHSSLSAPPASRIAPLEGPTTRMGRALDADKMAMLGIRNTMRMAKLYNGLRNGRRQRMRARQRRASGLEPRLRMADGFVLDESMS